MKSTTSAFPTAYASLQQGLEEARASFLSANPGFAATALLDTLRGICEKETGDGRQQ